MNILYSKIAYIFLPSEYPDSVKPAYRGFICWGLGSSMISGCASILSTQALLIAMGLKDKGSLTATTTVNWLLKDVAGQMGGLFTALGLANNYDAELKITRLYATAFFHCTTIGSALAIGSPKWFLAIASLSNIARCASLVSMSSTRASVLSRLSNGALLGELTARAHAQNTVANIVGQTFGVVMSYYLSITSMYAFLIIQLPLALASLFCTYNAIKDLEAKELTSYRLYIAYNMSKQCTIEPSPVDVGTREPILSLIWLPRINSTPLEYAIKRLRKDGLSLEEASSRASDWIPRMESIGWKILTPKIKSFKNNMV